MPSEIEEIINEISHVEDVAVVGVKDEFFGENLIGHIVSRKKIRIQNKYSNIVKKSWAYLKHL